MLFLTVCRMAKWRRLVRDSIALEIYGYAVNRLMSLGLCAYQIDSKHPIRDGDD